MINQIKHTDIEVLALFLKDIQTPTRGVLGYIRLVKDGLCDNREEELELLEEADEAATRAYNNIDVALDFFKILCEVYYIEQKVVNLATIIQDITHHHKSVAEEKGLWLKYDIPPSMGIEVNSDKLIEILGYILSSAIIFTETGGITIEIRTQQHIGESRHTISMPQKISTDREHHWVVMSFKDTGCGIAMNLERRDIFRSFLTNSNRTCTPVCDGRVLQLFMYRHLIEYMNGRLCVHSDGINKGSTVEIALPIYHNPRSGGFEFS